MLRRKIKSELSTAGQTIHPEREYADFPHTPQHNPKRERQRANGLAERGHSDSEGSDEDKTRKKTHTDTRAESKQDKEKLQRVCAKRVTPNILPLNLSRPTVNRTEPVQTMRGDRQ